MKYISRMLYLVLFAMALQNCTDKNDVAPSKEKLQFSLNLNSVPEGSTLRVSIQKKSGESVLELQSFELQPNDNNSLTTSAIELLTGNYVITDFLVVSKENTILYATPKKGSPMALKVKNSVEKELLVSKGSSPVITMEVLSVANALPENFGYATFRLNVIHPLKVTVSVPYLGGLKITGAKAYILQGIDTVQQFNISPKVNILPYTVEPDEEATLVVVKDGYALYSSNFVYNNLTAGTLKVTLTPAFTFVAFNDEEISYPFSILISGVTSDNHVTINWGDGTIEPLEPNGDDDYQHDYLSTRNYFVSVTGDLEVITAFKSYYGLGMIDNLNLENLPNLEDVIFGLTRSPEVIDLTHNKKIEFLNLAGLVNATNINLPVTNKVRFINVGGFSHLTNTSLNDIIIKVYNSAIRNKTRYGQFSYPKSWSQDEFDMSTVAIPTPASLTMLHTLRDDYGWNLWPNK